MDFAQNCSKTCYYQWFVVPTVKAGRNSKDDSLNAFDVSNLVLKERKIYFLNGLQKFYMCTLFYFMPLAKPLISFKLRLQSFYTAGQLITVVLSASTYKSHIILCCLQKQIRIDPPLQTSPSPRKYDTKSFVRSSYFRSIRRLSVSKVHPRGQTGLPRAAVVDIAFSLSFPRCHKLAAEAYVK